MKNVAAIESSRLAVTYLTVSDLAPGPRNARTYPKRQIDQIRRSIEAFGFTNPIPADPDGRIIASCSRLQAARLMGLSLRPAAQRNRGRHCRLTIRARARPPGTEFLDAETGRQKSPPKWVSAHRDKITGNKGSEIPAETRYLASGRKRSVCEDWMVETIWIELPASHAGIEPVSETRVRNGIFCCRDRTAKWADSPRLREQRPR
jgi:ParB-like nuclease domain